MNEVAEATENTDNATAPVTSDNQSDWRDGLSDDLRADPTLANINDAESAAKTLVHQQQMLGSRIPIPKTDDERMEVYDKLGRPESADGYELEIPSGYEQQYPAEMLSSFKERGHELGLSPQQMQGLVEWQKGSFDYQSQQEAQLGDQIGVSTEDELRKEYGAHYEKNLTAAQRALRVYGTPELQQKLEDPRFGNDPDLIRLLAAAGKDISEDSAQGTSNNSLVMSPLDAKMKIGQINDNKEHAYWNPKDPKHMDAQAEMNQLYSKAF
jgi:hypothetical protein